MFTSITIPLTPMVQEQICEDRTITENVLIDKFNEFMETEFIIKDIETAFKQVQQYKQGKMKFKSARKFLTEFNV